MKKIVLATTIIPALLLSCNEVLASEELNNSTTIESPSSIEVPTGINGSVIYEDSMNPQIQDNTLQIRPGTNDRPGIRPTVGPRPLPIEEDPYNNQHLNEGIQGISQ
ncbi:hypothetical protein [Adonisia turfae]|uniref:Lipoprotein n=1 Tax=Adonisia turfae CCMR0081 TaxID=2292702 RepID=A0A6M0RGI1_9CYAN|nr:hypothetical protein [Adonisia turfae]NEZ55387.1 hypothetical protein [Adonisia turfae CCMR0081]